ncbi:MAG TPA: chromosomal replication initiator protein DnaA [Solirubrobacteraceae bacterium]|nr:chromosomal replication initiator protein DnaA [Solirubrobacteraceae bacterium]
MSRELDHIWSQVQAQLALVVDESTFRIWLEPLRPVELRGDTLVIQATPPACRWTRERFGRVIHASVELTLGTGACFELIGAPEGQATSEAHRSRGPEHAPGRHAAEAVRLDTSTVPSNPKLTFDQFVIGDSNRLAHAAALAVAEMPGHAYNPLYLCGPPGVGKTHLLSSIANLLCAHHPGLTVRMSTGEGFTNAFLAALASGQTEAFKLRFRDVDVLLLDDVQFLERKTRTEEEFFHTFNALHDSGRQLVLTSDRPPSDLEALEDRLRERFQAGLVADIRPPDPTTRLAILRKRAQHDHIALADEQPLELIAGRVCSNVRALEGALIRVVAYSSLTGKPVTTELAGRVLDGLYPQALPTPRASRSVADIQDATCKLFGLTREELLSPARAARIAWPRQLAMYLARELTDESLPAIGRHFGGRDHTTVMHACRRAAHRIASDPASGQAVENIQRALALPASAQPSQPADRSS